MTRMSRTPLSLVLAATLLGAAPERPVAAADPEIFVSYLSASSQGGRPPAAGNSGMQVQNLDPALEAQLTIELYPQNGGPPQVVSRPNVAAGAAANLYMGVVRPTGIYSAIVRADRPIAAIARTDWGASGGAALYGDSKPGLQVVVPLVAKAYGGQSTMVTIHNTDRGTTAAVTIDVNGAGSAQPLASLEAAITPGTSVTLDLARHPAFVGLPPGFLGSMVARSTTPIGVLAFTYVDSGKGVYAYEGAPPDRAATRLYAPLIRNDLGGTTGISVVNPGESAVDVRVTYIGSALTPVCAGRTVHGGRSFALAPKASAVFYQGNVATLATGDSGLARGCLGSALIESTGGAALAIVNDADLTRTSRSPGFGSSAAYNAFSDADGGTRVALPLYRKSHAGNLDLSTGIQVMNLGGDPATVRIEVRDDRGKALPTGADGQVTIAPLGSHTWYPPAMPSLPSSSYGSAVVTSDQPIVAIVNDASGRGVVDAAIYGGIKAD